MIFWLDSSEYRKLHLLIMDIQETIQDIKVDRELGKRREPDLNENRVLDAIFELNCIQKYSQRLIEHQDNYNDLLHRITKMEQQVAIMKNSIDNSPWFITRIKSFFGW